MLLFSGLVPFWLVRLEDFCSSDSGGLVSRQQEFLADASAVQFIVIRWFDRFQEDEVGGSVLR